MLHVSKHVWSCNVSFCLFITSLLDFLFIPFFVATIDTMFYHFFSGKPIPLGILKSGTMSLMNVTNMVAFSMFMLTRPLLQAMFMSNVLPLPLLLPPWIHCMEDGLQVFTFSICYFVCGDISVHEHLSFYYSCFRANDHGCIRTLGQLP